eukprot:CAMPEP_0182418900 /NCGR_PEP_ID=MMETSP1167-20130531/3281_1 /TAXON_ID=2988 /ORGANISM="Mallomonas Sp, Strain CCMP3275" /LENGTH=135 /DNA_ID=CAMNT_0024593373 /DNA_START=298 /DNA_END=705 /DNA_ORIENTATION=-
MTSAETARLRVVVQGPSTSTALFRSDVKKNLVFFRGCSSIYSEIGNDSAEIIAEGKKPQLERFIQWCNELSSEAAKAKSSFQSPKHEISVTSVDWQEYVGDLKGFTATSAPPSLGEPHTEGQIEASTMGGTDESV